MLRQFFCYEWRWKLKAVKYCCIFIAASWWSSVLFHLSDRSIRSRPRKERQRMREGTETNEQLHSFSCCILSPCLYPPWFFFFLTEKLWTVIELGSSMGVPVTFSGFSTAPHELPPFQVIWFCRSTCSYFSLTERESVDAEPISALVEKGSYGQREEKHPWMWLKSEYTILGYWPYTLCSVEINPGLFWCPLLWLN